MTRNRVSRAAGRTGYGLDTPRDAPWQERAACGTGTGVDPECWWPDRGDDERTGLALHICWAHCPVRAECDQEARESPPDHPQVIGGRRYTYQTGTSGQVGLARRAIPTTTRGCPTCPPPTAPLRNLLPIGGPS